MKGENKLIKHKIFLLIGDVFLLYFCFFISLKVRRGIFFEHPNIDHLVLGFSGAFLIWLTILYILDFYEKPHGKNLEFFQKLSLFVISGISSSVILFYILDIFSVITPKTLLLLNILFFALFFTGWRNLAEKLFKSSFKKKAVFIGFNPELPELIKTLNDSFYYGYKTISCFSENNDDLTALQKISQLTEKAPATNINELCQIIKQEKVQLIVIAEDIYLKNDLIKFLFLNLPLNKLSYLNFVNFYEYITRKVPLASINEFWFLKNLAKNKKKFYEISKRGFDVLLAFVGLIPFLILFPFIALSIKLTSAGPIFYREPRPGEGNKIFNTWKFRTMTHDLSSHKSLTIKNDNRITKAGSFLRKFHLDELPQLINILIGEISFVGPRAIPLKSAQEITKTIPFYVQRQLVKPGLTGWAQINAPYFDSHQKEEYEKLQYDLYYIKHRSFVFDLGIILNTIKRILTAKGR